MDNQEPKLQAPAAKPNTVSLSLDLKYICVALVLIIVAMLALWRPWQVQASDNSRVVKVTGEAKVTAEPDEFVFYPSYEFKNASKDVALAELTKKSDEVIKKLKELGVAANKVKTDSSGGEDYLYYYDPESRLPTYTLRLTVTIDKKELAQKVQDYLVSTSPTGSVSPQASFSDQKRKSLEQQARDEATRQAREKAEQSAKNLGFKIGKVKNIEDSGFGGIGCGSGLCRGIALDTAMSAGSEKSTQSLAVQPGENELHYSVSVEYYIR